MPALTSARPGAAGSPSPTPTSRNDFYLRAGLVLDKPEKTRFKDTDCTSTSPAALYGCGNGIDNAPLSSLGDFGTTAGFELGLGYAATPALRLEALIQYRPNFSFEGRANFTQTTDQQAVSADLSSLIGMLAAYLDLPELGLPRPGPFSPFIGAGGGLSRINIDETHMAFPKTTTIVPGGQRGNFAWMLVAGFAASPGEKVTLDLAWRYTDYGAVETGRAKGRIVWRDGNRDPLEIDLAGTRAGPARAWTQTIPALRILNPAARSGLPGRGHSGCPPHSGVDYFKPGGMLMQLSSGGSVEYRASVRRQARWVSARPESRGEKSVSCSSDALKNRWRRGRDSNPR